MRSTKNLLSKIINKFKKGFTLLEFILVIGIIAVLAGMVIIAINPNKQLANVRNIQRLSDLKQINNALVQYYIDNGRYPAASVVNSYTEICNTGPNSSTSTSVTGELCGSLANLSDLVPAYVVSIPADPQGSIVGVLDSIIPTAMAATTIGTGYKIQVGSDNKVTLYAPQAENNVVVAVGTTTIPAVTYTLAFNTDGGSTAPSPINGITSGSTTTLPVAPTKSGFTFAGWYTQINGEGSQFTVSTALVASITVYAKWTINTYTINYNGNSNTGGSIPSSQTKTENIPLSLQVNSGSLVRTGYTFSGWNTAADGSGITYAVGASYTANADVTMYAKWMINTYTVTYNGNGNTGGTVPADQTKTHDVTLTLATNSGGLVKTGYTFSGWNTAANGSGSDYTAGASYVANSALTLYPKWAVFDACTHVATNPACWSNEIVLNNIWGPQVATGVLDINDGMGNTANLAARGANYYAANYCYGLTEGGLPAHTWYLPAKQQLDDAMTNQFITHGSMTGFVAATPYWSSTEHSVGGVPTTYGAIRGFYHVGNNYLYMEGDNKMITTHKIRCLR